MKVTLKDGAPRSAGSVEINVSKNGNTLEIGATGVEPAPLVLEFYEGSLRLRVYGDPAVAKKQPEFITTLATKPTAKATEEYEGDGTAGNPRRLKANSVVAPAKPTAQETVNAVLPPPANAPEFDEAAFDAA